jgi:adenylate cyclase
VDVDIPAEATTLRFDDFLLEMGDRTLLRLNAQSTLTRVPLGGRAFDILCMLIKHRGEFVSKNDMMDRIWQGAAVEENNLTVQISALRRVLDAGRGGESCIQTVPGRGYRFLPHVKPVYAAVTGSDTADWNAADSAAVPPTSDAAQEARTDLTAQVPRRRSWQRVLGSAIALSIPVFISVAVLVWYTSRPPIKAAERPRLSVVIMPFDNLSGDPADDYLADSVTGEVTTDLSRVPTMFVISQASAEHYRGKSDDPIAIGQQLGVRYLVKGSVRKLGDTVRVNAQLIATETGQQLWADRFEKKLNELSSGQDEIVVRIGRTLNVAMLDIESARSKRERPASPDAFDLILRARSIWSHPMGQREEAESLALFEQALRLDPTSIEAMAGIVNSLIQSNRRGDDLQRAASLLAAAAAINPDDERVVANTGFLLRRQHRWEEAITVQQRVLKFDPNLYWSHSEIGMCLIALGRAEDAIPMLEKANRLDPLGPYAWSRYQYIGWAMLMLMRDEEAISWTQRALSANPNVRPDWRALYILRMAAAHARLGHRDEALRLIGEANHVWPYDTVRSHYPDDLNHPEKIEPYQAALRLAGERDHADEDADFGVESDDTVHEDLAGPTPKAVPGAITIRTDQLERLLTDQKPIVIDPMAYWWGRSLPGAVGLENAGSGFAGEIQDRLGRKMRELTNGDLSKPIVAIGWNSERFDGRNLALRLVALGYTQIYWYRGGREAWEVNGLPEVRLTAADW